MLVNVLHEVNGSNQSAAELKTLLGNHLPEFLTPVTLLKVGVAVTINQPTRRMLLNLNLWFCAHAIFSTSHEYAGQICQEEEERPLN